MLRECVALLWQIFYQPRSLCCFRALKMQLQRETETKREIYTYVVKLGSGPIVPLLKLGSGPVNSRY